MCENAGTGGDPQNHIRPKKARINHSEMGSKYAKNIQKGKIITGVIQEKVHNSV